MLFTKSSLKNSVKWLLNNCYFKLDNKIFRQISGTSMGFNLALFFANLFLFYYKNEWIKKVKKTDIRQIW